MRQLQVRIERNESGWTVSWPAGNPLGLAGASRRLGRAETDPPMPTCPLGETSAEGAAQAVEWLRRCLEGQIDSDAVSKLGRYLADVLLGPAALELDRLADHDPIEIQIEFPSDEAELHRLPWELMLGQDLPLAANERREIAITRYLPGTADLPTQPLELPLRVLFVVGRQLDESLRPGAEYFGLLREAQIVRDGARQSVDLHTKVLLEATPGELKEAMKSFRPHVVHFVCHGDLGGPLRSGRLMLTQKEETKNAHGASVVVAKPLLVDAAELLDLLRPDKELGRLPAVVFLNACHSADSGELAESRQATPSLCAQLVRGGIPTVIGMAGEVADAACRLFARSFYSALLAEKPLAAAVAGGRRAALREFGAYWRESIEWARLNLYISASSDAAVRFDPDLRQEMWEQQQSLQRFSGATERRYCSRARCQRVYDEFMAGLSTLGRPKVMAVGVEESQRDKRYGKTWAMRTLSAHLAFEGFVPLGIYDQPPQSFLELALRLAAEMDRALENFGLEKRWKSGALEFISAEMVEEAATAGKARRAHLFRQMLDKARLVKTSQAKDEKVKDVDANTFKEILHGDAAALRKDLSGAWLRRARERDERRAKAEPPLPPLDLRPPHFTPIVLLDNAHQYEGVTNELLVSGVVTQDGLGGTATGARLVIPLIFTHSTGQPAPAQSNLCADAIAAFIKDPRLVLKTTLGKFDEEQEFKLALSHWLLTRPKPETEQEIGPLAINWRARKQAETFVNVARKVTQQGVPSLLADDNQMLHGVIVTTQAMAGSTFQPADDEALFQPAAL